MIPQGSVPVNLHYFTSLQDRIEGVGSCEELKSLASDAIASINASTSAIQDQLALLAPILALLTAPSASPSAIVTWITNFITSFLTPHLRPSVVYASQLTEIASRMASIAAAINAKASSFEACVVDLTALP